MPLHKPNINTNQANRYRNTRYIFGVKQQQNIVFSGLNESFVPNLKNVAVGKTNAVNIVPMDPVNDMTKPNPALLPPDRMAKMQQHKHTHHKKKVNVK